MGFARSVADKIVFMADGKIEASASPDEFFTQNQGDRVESFLAKIIHK
jgi:ABC-type polar amino acid transport system ATPase subunit